MRRTFLPGPDANKHGLFSRCSHVHFHIFPGKMLVTPLPLLLFGSVLCMDTSPKGQFLHKIIPSGDAPRIPEEWNQIPVSFTSNPVLRMKALMASSSLFTPHCTAFTLDRSYSPRRCLTSEGVNSLAPPRQKPGRVVLLANS